MSEQILAVLKRKLEEISAYGEADAKIKLNVLKEELQFYVLNFIYHHPEYSKWIMYGGSALRIIHGLDRMSVDLDFEVSQKITDSFLEDLKNEVEKYFASVYSVKPDFLVIKKTRGRGLLLKFNIKELNIGYPSELIYVKIDLNKFVAPKTVTERRPINHNQFSFVILTYNMSALMASKIAAILLRGTREVGKAVYEEKGRDIYDLLWYMAKKAMPDLDYLIAKGVDAKDPRALFNKLTIQMNKVNDDNLKNDLMLLFTDQSYIGNWLENWRENYFRLLDEYEINTITKLEGVRVHQDFDTDIFHFAYRYKTEKGGSARVIYAISDVWIRRTNISILIDNRISEIIEFANDMSAPQQKKLKQYATLFNQKTEAYFKKTNRIMIGNSIITKLIRITADNLNQKEQIVLDESALLSRELDDLLK